MTLQERSNRGTCTSDSTEEARRKRLEQLNTEPGSRGSLEAVHGQVWDTSELQRDFMVVGFLAPFVHVRRRVDQEEGSLEFQHQPRFYFNFRRANR